MSVELFIGRRFRTIVDSVLDFPVAEPIRPPPARSCVHLYVHIPFCHTLCPFCSFHRVRLDVDKADGLPRLDAVEPELRAVLQALVVNAVEASPEAGRVTVRAAGAGPGRLRVEIEDEGEGLAEEIRERLFTPHLSTKANGSGMGLFLAHRIATTRYGGSLELLDRDQQGTRAVLEIGARTPAAGEEAGDE